MKGSRRLVALLVSIALLLLVAACAWQGLRADSNAAPKHLYVLGDLSHKQAGQVVAAASPYLQAGFFDLDNALIRVAVARLPWVAHAHVHRRWPDSVVVRVRVRQAVAHWDNDAWLAVDGTVFTGADPQATGALPFMSGPRGSGQRLLAEWAILQRTVRQLNRRITGLALGPGGWEVTLEDGLVLRLGRRHMQQRLTRFISYWSSALASRLQHAGYVDLRYADGFAVGGTRNKAAHKHSKESGHEQAT